MAYAELAGLSPVAGLYALLLPAVAYAVFGSSPFQLVVGPEGSISALIATAHLPLAAGDPEGYASLAAVLALMVGGCFLLARVLRLGWVADYFSQAVLIGYIHGIAVVLVVGQLSKLFGLDIEATEPIGQLMEFFQKLPESSGTTVVVGSLCLVSLLLLRTFAKRLPGLLIVVVIAIGASAALDLQEEGIAVVGTIPPGRAARSASQRIARGLFEYRRAEPPPAAMSSRIRPANDRETSRNDKNGWGIESAGEGPDSDIDAGSRIGPENTLKVETWFVVFPTDEVGGTGPISSVSRR